MSARTPWQERWSQLTAMSWDELHIRTRQEIAKRWDAALYHSGVRFDGEGSGSLDEAPARFFFEPSDLHRLVALLRERLPAEADLLVERAQRICEHRFDLLGYEKLDYGREIDWHRDAVHGKRAPRKPWYQIRFLDFDQVGDAKITWELNRHQHLVTLAKAYCVTKEERFVTELLHQWYHWQQENPYPIGINWASSLEVAYRSLSWLWVRYFLTDCPAVPSQFRYDLDRALALNARHIERFLSTYFSPNTHLLGEGVGLFFIGTLCPQFLSAQRWQRKGWEIVLQEAQRQVLRDGMHFEQSTYYHVYALDLFLHARMLARRNQVPIPAALDETLEKMLELMRALGQDGTFPRFGDDDGGRVFDSARSRTPQLLDPLATGAVLFGRADFKATAGGLHEEALWLLGAEGVAQFDQIPSVRPLGASVGFESSGIYVMASPEPLAQKLVIDAGAFGVGRAGHGHADALSLYLTVNGREWLTDPGTFSYVSGEAERNFFRGTGAHNTLQVDGCSQAEPAGPFAWRSLPDVRVENWVAGETFDLFVGHHTGYCRLPQPVTHRRCVFYLKQRFWLVRDQATGDGRHQLDLCWHLSPNVSDFKTVGNAIVGAAKDKQTLFLLPMEGHGWLQEFSQGWWSPVYGRKEQSPMLHFRTESHLPAEFVTLLLPSEEGIAQPGVLRRIDDGIENPAVFGYRYSSPDECSYMFFAEGGQRWELGRWASDAFFVFCSMAPNNVPRHLVLCGGSYIEIDGQRVAGCERPVARSEWLNRGGEWQIFCSDEVTSSVLPEIVPTGAGLVSPGVASPSSSRGAR